MPSFGTSVSVPLLAGDGGTEQTVELIRTAVNSGLSNPVVRSTAMQALRGVPAYNDEAAARALFNWVLRNIRFTNDPIGHETISSAEWTIRNGGGDCDDINAVLLPTLLMVVGIPVELVTVNDNPTDPAGEFTHVYCQALINGRVTPLDAARPGARFGTTIDRVFRKRVWSLTDARYQDLAGYRGLNGSYTAPAQLARSRRGMGFDFSALADLINKGASAAGNIIQSFRVPTGTIINPGASCKPGTPGCNAVMPGGYPTSSGIDPTLLLGGMGILAVAIIASKK